MWWLNEIDKDRLVTIASRADILFWQHNLTANPDLNKIFSGKISKHYGADLFNVLSRLKPRLKPRAEVQDKAFRAWLNKLTKTESYEKLKNKTIGNRETAASATVKLYRKFQSIENLQQSNKQLKTIQKLQQSIEDAQDDENDELIKALEDAQENLEKIIDDESKSDNNTQEIKQVTNEISDEIEDMQRLATLMLGGGYSNDNSTDSVVADLLSMKKIIAILKKKDLKEILDYAGRMVAILENKRKTGIHRSVVPMDITQGNDLANVIPGEMALLVDDETEDLFTHKYNSQTLVQFRKRSKQSEGRGPIVFCQDYSGSMRGKPENMAMALLVVIAREATKEKRSLAFIPFASTAQDPPVIINNVIDLANAIAGSYNVGGGTDFVRPLTVASRMILECKQMNKADIVFISDGICMVPPEFIKKFIEDKTEHHWKNIGVSINSKFRQEQLPMFDGIMHMGYSGNLDWFTDFTRGYLER